MGTPVATGGDGDAKVRIGTKVEIIRQKIIKYWPGVFEKYGGIYGYVSDIHQRADGIIISVTLFNLSAWDSSSTFPYRFFLSEEGTAWVRAGEEGKSDS